MAEHSEQAAIDTSVLLESDDGIDDALDPAAKNTFRRPALALLMSLLSLTAGLAVITSGGGAATKASKQFYERIEEFDALKPCKEGDKASKDKPCHLGQKLKLNRSSGKYVLRGRTVDKDDETKVSPKCSWPLQNCTDSQCCMKPGQQCYLQNHKTNYASCMDSCTPGPHPSHWDGQWWICDKLGHRTNGSSHCSKMGEDCSKTMCCEEANTQCFEKAKGWATCKSSCAAGAPDLSDVDDHHWSCKKLGPWTQGAAPWVPGQCAGDGDDCREKKCCSNPGAQCYEQNSDWAACRYDCKKGKDPARQWEPEWSCNEIGMRTPGTGPPPPSTVSKWVHEKCAWPNNDCSQSRCCMGMNLQCYSKNEKWAVCKESCTKGPDPYDNNETWSCNELGQRSMGLPIKGSPSLFCWSLFQTTTYEMDIMKNQMTKGSGIFQCDDWALLSTADPTKLGQTPAKEDATTMHVDMAEITMSVDGTAGNAKLFINCWNVIVQDGRWNNHAWTVKVDPDAVLLPDRLRVHLASHVLENVYVVNCNKFPSSPNFPMMYGSLEIYSWRAIQTYANSMGSCMADMGMMLPQWGEDYFMTHCLDHIGVGRIADFASVGDNVCLGANCGDGWVAAFHPFKSADEWQKCWDIAHR
jgi:hypothetical protein